MKQRGGEDQTGTAKWTLGCMLHAAFLSLLVNLLFKLWPSWREWGIGYIIQYDGFNVVGWMWFSDIV